VGTQTGLNLIKDSRTTNRWYLVAVMVRTAGHLALGVGKSTGATITIIPKEFSKPCLFLDEMY
jgi:6-phosphofructokinase 1